MIPNLYIGNGCFTKHPFLNGCLEFQVGEFDETWIRDRFSSGCFLLFLVVLLCFPMVFFPVLPVLPVVWHTYLLRSPPLKGKVDSHKGMSKTASKCLKSWNSRKPSESGHPLLAMEVFRLDSVTTPEVFFDVNANDGGMPEDDLTASYWVKRFGRFGVFLMPEGCWGCWKGTIFPWPFSFDLVSFNNKCEVILVVTGISVNDVTRNFFPPIVCWKKLVQHSESGKECQERRIKQTTSTGFWMFECWIIIC